MTDGHFASFDGTRLWYEVYGEGERDIILCDGIGCDGFIWRYLSPQLEPNARIIHLHMRGHGKSDPPADPENLKISDLADDWNELLKQLNVVKPIVIGHSMGVQVALELFYRHPERVGALVLMCGSFENPAATFHNDRLMELMLPYLRGATRLGGDRLKRVWSRLIKLPVAFKVAQITEIHPDLTRRSDFEPYLEHLSGMDPHLFFRLLSGAAAHSADAYIDRVDVPTLVIGGVDDRFTPGWLSEHMAERIPGAQLLMVEEGTHTAPIEHPTLINVRVTQFIDAASVNREYPA